MIYHDAENTEELTGKKIGGVHAYCFCKGKLVLVYSDKKKYWTPPGGGVEPGETIEEAVTREVQEETNMKVISQRLLGYQEIFEPNGTVIQTRSVCIVEPYGDFVADPDGDITKIQLIGPEEYSNYKRYFDWGVVGDHIIRRAIELKENL